MTAFATVLHKESTVASKKMVKMKPYIMGQIKNEDRQIFF